MPKRLCLSAPDSCIHSGQNGNEAKLVLWWSKAFELILRQLDFSGDCRGCVQALLKLIPALNSLGEDRASSGLMGAIGLGRKSQLSVKYSHHSLIAISYGL
jgi:hypothetical protein